MVTLQPKWNTDMFNMKKEEFTVQIEKVTLVLYSSGQEEGDTGSFLGPWE